MEDNFATARKGHQLIDNYDPGETEGKKLGFRSGLK